MTLKELSQLYYLNKEIERDKRRLRELKATQMKITASYSDMPTGSKSIHDTMAEKVADIVDLEEILRLNIQKRYYEEKRIMHFIASIDDCLLRLVFKLRFVDCKKWWEVANELGGNNTALTVRNCCYRYLDRIRICSKCSKEIGYNIN